MKESKNYKICLVNFDEKREEIIELRDVSWSKNPTGNEIRYSVDVDNVLDVKCSHIVVYLDDKIVAAARMQVTSVLSEVFNSRYFESETKEMLKGSYGSITRVVVHPDHRLNGLAVKVMMGLEVEARKMDVHTLLGYPADWSMKLMNICEYEMVENLGDVIKELPGVDHYLMIKVLD